MPLKRAPVMDHLASRLESESPLKFDMGRGQGQARQGADIAGPINQREGCRILKIRYPARRSEDTLPDTYLRRIHPNPYGLCRKDR